MIVLDKIESNRNLLESKGDYVWFKTTSSPNRIKKHECWEIINVNPDDNVIYLKKVGRKIMTEKPLNLVVENCLLIKRNELNLL